MGAAYDMRGLPSMWAAALMRHQELLAEALDARRVRLREPPRSPRFGAGVRRPLGALPLRAGEALQGAPVRGTFSTSTVVETDAPIVRAGDRCPLCRRSTWPPPLAPDDAPRAIAAAEDLIRAHQRRRSC